ncbi:MAG TPA: thioredoxin family protein, partial [Planctomycetota bacterium]|nr:thioredoxin family protein [Planctomycetota bacterium]
MAAWACTLGLAALALPARAAGFPAAYEPLVLRPSGLPEHAEFDLSAALERARREHKRLYVYLGADDCRYCRRYEAFLEQHSRELAPHFVRTLSVTYAGRKVFDADLDFSIAEN